MSDNAKTIVVELAGKYGPKVDGVFFGTAEGVRSTDFVTGGKYDVLTAPWTSKGKSGLNITEIVKNYGNGNGGNTSEKPPLSFSSLGKPVDWAAKDRSQLIGGVYHDAEGLTRVSFELEKTPEEIVERHSKIVSLLLDARAKLT